MCGDSNESGTLGGGVSRAIFLACGGSALQDEMTAKLEADYDGLLEEGDCLVTTGGTSQTIRWVLHVPSVDYRDKATRSDSSLERVRECTQAALQDVVKLTGEHVAPLDLPVANLLAVTQGKLCSRRL